ncbi:MAG TPA: hypothetical protein VHV51_09610 [Polyangiaceae bacterium]|jgi:hypothetical protein|nr:hypothetical protein [Polyangiaceae bacterium]
MTPFLLRLSEHLHGHLGWLSTLALIHPALLLRKRMRRSLLAASLATALATLTGVLGALLYPAYRELVKPEIFQASTAFGNAFERKEHLAVGVVVLAWVGLVAHFAECRERGVDSGSTRVSFVAYASAATLAVLTGVFGVAVAAFRSF